MSIQFVWKDMYSVGDAEIDAQHRGLFDLGNTVPEVSEGQDVQSIIMRLFKYTREHFSTEEAMMERIGFPQVTEHRALHDELISKLNEISARPLDTDEAICDFKQFIYNWLIDHVMNEDNKYFQFRQNRIAETI